MANALLVPPLRVSVITASGTSIGAPESLLNDYAGVVWRSAPADAGSIYIDLGSDQFVDTIALFGLYANFGPGAYAGIAVATEAQGSFVGGNFWSSPPVPIFSGSSRLPAGDGVMLTRLSELGAPPASRYLTIQFFNLGAGGYVQASRLVVGRAIVLERNFSFGATFGVRDLGSLDFNRRGVMQRTRGKKLRTAGLTFSTIRKDELEAYTGPLLERLGNTDMVALVTDPSPGAELPRRCFFGPLVGDLGHSWRRATAFEAKINLVSIY